ncbi:MAG: 2-succinyl-5-enolpyruvyl-6-hydroxy-3-cyclohexene-1-carboxylate synthase [Flavobacteriaceae bacterium]|jgi:2-succinyl-5-enolpyruvyl-6-hydroxy-3-cyclohexene-1-carboxylate synthase|tara:strand:+ start:405 stop:2192 length:1788 start_codon:yes stop_codon:yes gene_type:complete
MNKYPSIPLAQTVVRLCAQNKIERVVICAGSRNAPLTNGFVSDSSFKTYSIVDERAAAFFALGMAQQLKQPVALVCTSGSALLNFYPAIAEAFYSDIPLVVLSADRMPHRIDIGDGQTIRQTGVFDLHIETSAILKPDVSHATETLLQNPMQQLLSFSATPQEIKEIQRNNQHHNEQEILRVLNVALNQKGPVHLNIPLEEPLYEMTSEAIPLAEYKLEASAFFDDHKLIQRMKQQWHKTPKKWVIIGVLSPGAIEQKQIDLLCEDPSVIVFTETTSNIKHSKTIYSIDTLMASLEISEAELSKTLQPELVLTFGGMVVSKKIKFFLRNNPPQYHWHVDEKKAYNTYYRLDQHLKATPTLFLDKLYKDVSITAETSYQKSILSLFETFKSKGRTYLDSISFSDLNVFDHISKTLPEGIQLQISNSSSIRYAQLMEWPTKTTFFCNRGTSGIDGSTATAIGAALIAKTPTVLITGDLSFFYDINGLWNDYIPSNFKILLINNNGGGIFRIIKGEKDSPKYDRYFETIHNRNAKHLAKVFGFSYQKAETKLQLKRKLVRFYKAYSTSQLLEIKTPRKLNDIVLLNYFKAMAINTIIL